MEKIKDLNLSGTMELQSRVCDWLRFPMAVAVVVLHSFQGKIDVAGINWADPSWQNFCSALVFGLTQVLTHLAVPVFFVISGFYFFAGTEKFGKTEYFSKLKKRSRTLLVPYLSWNFLMLATIIVSMILATFLKDKPIERIGEYLCEHHLRFFWDSNVGSSANFGWFGNEIYSTYPVLVPLWFVRDLMVVMLLSPLIFWCLKKFGKIFLMILAFCFVARAWPNIHGLRIDALFFFSAGAFFAVRGESILDFCKKINVPALMIATLLFVPVVIVGGSGSDSFWGQNLMPVFRIFGVICAFNFSRWLLENNFVPAWKKLSQASFFIFAAHGCFVLMYAKILTEKLVPANGVPAEIFCYLFPPVLTIALCVLSDLFLKKFFPKISKLLTGGR